MTRLRSSPAICFAATILTVAVAAALRIAFNPWVGSRLPFMTFYPAIMICGWFGGMWPGILASVLSTAIAYFEWFGAAGSFSGTSAGDALGLFVFTATGVMLSIVTGSLHR